MNIEVKVIEVIKEDATATVSGSAGMGAVTAAQLVVVIYQILY
jgi:hypothetical protein